MFTQISQPRFRIMIRGTANYYIILFFVKSWKFKPRTSIRCLHATSPKKAILSEKHKAR